MFGPGPVVFTGRPLSLVPLPAVCNYQHSPVPRTFELPDSRSGQIQSADEATAARQAYYNTKLKIAEAKSPVSSSESLIWRCAAPCLSGVTFNKWPIVTLQL